MHSAERGFRADGGGVFAVSSVGSVGVCEVALQCGGGGMELRRGNPCARRTVLVGEGSCSVTHGKQLLVSVARQRDGGAWEGI